MTGHLSRLSYRCEDSRRTVCRSGISFRNWYTAGCAGTNKCTRPRVQVRRARVRFLWARDKPIPSPRTAATESCGRARYLRELRNKWPTTTFLAWRTKRGREFRFLSPAFPISTLFRGPLAGSGYLRICLYIVPHTYNTSIYSLLL